MKRRAAATLGLMLVAACGGSSEPTRPTTPPPAPPPTAPIIEPVPDNLVAPSRPAACPPGPPMMVHFYDAGQALSVLVTLPDGRRLLVDTGESPSRPCKASACKAWHERVMAGLHHDLGTKGLDALWITHQHSDHVGGAEDVLTSFKVASYNDNGLDLDKTAVVRNARAAITTTGTKLVVVDPEHVRAPLKGTDSVKFTPIVPKAWPSSCPRDPNACTIGLRIDYCKSSVLFTGDAPTEEEDLWDTRGEVTLLQVGHHGSDTSSGEGLLAATKPRYAVISSGKPDEGTNDGYCHPRSIVVENLSTKMGGVGKRTIKAFDGKVDCDKKKPQPKHWIAVPAHDNIWSTARDGDVKLVTTGDGEFARE